MPRPILLFTALILLLDPHAARPADVTPLPIGASAPDFHLPGTDGKTYSLKNFQNAKILAVVFTCNHCPTAQAYEARLKKFYHDYHDRGVALVAISPNDPKALRLDELGYTDLSDSFEEMKIRARDHHFPFPYLYDGDTQTTARAYGALATPHVFLFDADRKLRYAGRFDDSDVKQVKSHDAVNAVNALLAGKPVPVETTRVFGCSTKWAEKKADAEKSLKKGNAEPVTLSDLTLKAAADLAKNDSKDYLLVNLWATWCGPCVSELPEFVTMDRMYRHRDFRLVTISLDEPDHRADALEVLKTAHASSTNYLLSAPDRDQFADALDPQWPGPIPYTLLIAPGGQIVYRHTGEIDPLEVKRAIVEHIGRTYASKR